MKTCRLCEKEIECVNCRHHSFCTFVPFIIECECIECEVE